MNDALQAQLGKNVRKGPSKTQIEVKNKKKNSMTDLRDHNVDLETYMCHMGSNSEKHDKRSKEVSLYQFLFELEHVKKIFFHFLGSLGIGWWRFRCRISVRWR